MKNRRLFAALLAVVMLLAALAGCAAKPGKTITVEVTHSDGTTKEFTIKTDEQYLRGALDQEKLIAGTDSEYGLYVLTVDGETVNEENQEWWGYTKSGEYVDVGVDSCEIADGDHYEFTFNVGW